MKKIRFFLLITVMLGTLAQLVVPASQALAQKHTSFTHTYNHIGDEGLRQRTDIPLAVTTIVKIATVPVVEAVMFWQDGCPHCHDVIENVLPPLLITYGPQFDLLMIDVSSMEDVNRLFEIGDYYNIPRERVGVPFLIIDEHVLIGSIQISTELPGLIESYLQQGGVGMPNIPNMEAFQSVTHLIPETEGGEKAMPPLPPQFEEIPTQPAAEMRSNGFVLAIVILVGMVLSLLFAIGCLVYSAIKNLPLKAQPAWQDWLIPVLCVLGLGVAAYLSYIEVTLTKAMCGPVGDCNTVQQSVYARLWGVLPIGVLGTAGYIAILAAWWAGRRKWGWISSQAPLALFGMTFFGTVFSAYLTYLEPFVIKAVCIWCITSAIIITLLMLLSLPPAMKSLIGNLDEEDGSE